MEEQIETVIKDIENVNSDVQRIDCNPILQLFKDIFKCITDSFNLFFICCKNKSE